jgi:hypothetical protein
VRPTGNFNVGLTNALLEPKHYRAMGDALWLYTYLLDRQTRRLDRDGLGQVAGGLPIRDSDISGTIGSSRRTVIRWRGILLGHDYITARRTPYGHVYAIAKPKKWAPKNGPDVTQPVHLSTRRDVQDPPTDVTQPVKRCDTTCTNKEEVSRDVSSSSSAAAFQKQMEVELSAAWDYYLDVFKKEETISPSATRIGMAILTELRKRFPTISSEQCARAMESAIDSAHRIWHAQPKKEYFSRWFGIFGKFETFYSLWDEP